MHLPYGIPLTVIPASASVSPIITTTEIQETRLNQRGLTHSPIRSGRLMSRTMKIRTKGSSTPFRTWESRIMRTSGKPGMRTTPAPTTISSNSVTAIQQFGDKQFGDRQRNPQTPAADQLRVA